MDEYGDQRDEDELWRSMTPESEPTRVRLFLPLVLVIVVLSVPWYLPGELASRVYSGLPVWVWCTLAASACLSTLTCWASLRWWRDEDPGTEPSSSRDLAPGDRA